MDFEVYCDESQPDVFWSKSVGHARFLMIGGLWLPAEKRVAVKAQINELKARTGFSVEVKWSKAHADNEALFRGLIDLFAGSDSLRFRCIAVEGNKVNLVHFHENDAELGFYKFYYQLIKHWILDFNHYKVFCDEKTNRAGDRLKTLRRTLDLANMSSVVESVQALPSHEVVLLQLADVLLGAASSRLNGTLSTGSVKERLVLHLEGLLGRPIAPTPRSEQKFNVFKINLQGGW